MTVNLTANLSHPYATAYALAQRLLDGARRDGGATLDPSTGVAPADGYMVGIAGRGTVLHDLGSTATAAAWVARTLTELAPGECLGSWLDDGLIYLDVSVNVDDLETAATLARETGELAIWDVTAGVEISTVA